ncbi:Hypothetical protein CINCED_3A003569 [Cinara cedri]|uniref:Uncharacterized protein n=1 Tax=Cinara cedri TaxID=506608 RepID=A0A5E4N4K2_9HEMI|nr:Hypothetical protein CINCED_3A003569 [Cinara cedri]
MSKTNCDEEKYRRYRTTGRSRRFFTRSGKSYGSMAFASDGAAESIDGRGPPVDTEDAAAAAAAAAAYSVTAGSDGMENRFGRRRCQNNNVHAFVARAAHRSKVVVKPAPD